MARFLAFDLGTSGGRAMLATLQDGQLTLDELARFQNQAVPVGETLYWDVLNLWHGVRQGLQAWAQSGLTIDGLALDSWAVDFALLDEAGGLLSNPVSNRDKRTNGMVAAVHEIIPREELYNRTGIQMMQINTLYQLYALRLAESQLLRHAAAFLSIADLLNYWLTGRQAVEFTSATCTQFYDPNAADWTHDLLARLDIPSAMLPEVVPPGIVLGPLAVAGFAPVPVCTVATHDTGSAVAAVPVDVEQGARFAYISSGSWSLMGAEVHTPVITPASLRYDFTNEGGVAGTFRLLKNILGMWLVQACQATWAAAGETVSHADAVGLAESAQPFGAVFDPHPNSPDFREPGDMPGRIRAFCQRTGQPVPADKGEVLRCIFESLALKYRQVLGQLEEVLGHEVDVIHIVGGGSRNALLCQMAADATGKPVIAGPAEATAMGNVIVQAMALGHIESLAVGRDVIRRSSDLVRYEPHPSVEWEQAYARFLAVAQG